jgi:trans-L-3-hydroxyproline dehydratase
VQENRVQSVYFHNVPSFVVELDAEVEMPGLGRISYDLAFGGAFYAYVPAAAVSLTCTPENIRPLIDAGMKIKRAIMASRSLQHPVEADLNFLYGTIFIGPPVEPGVHSRNVCIFAEGEVDRSPTGTGVSGRLAIHHARGELAQDQAIVIESIIGSRFTGRVVRTTTFGPYRAIIPEVEGRAFITGKHDHHGEFGLTIIPYFQYYEDHPAVDYSDKADKSIFVNPSAGYRFQKPGRSIFLKAAIGPSVFLDPHD